MHRYELHPIGEPAPIDEHIAELLERAAMNQHRAEVDRMLTEGRRAIRTPKPRRVKVHT